jgi:hypothetical protein
MRHRIRIRAISGEGYLLSIVALRGDAIGGRDLPHKFCIIAAGQQ